MTRLLEKVKDIVEVRTYPSLGDFLADPRATLEGYHFTDITSDLMAKWIDHVADAKPGRGAAMAMAGFRGVGKSHFLAVMGALVSQPDLRSHIADTHVLTTAQRLSRRHSPVSYVRRGSENSLVEELRSAIALTTGVAIEDLGTSLETALDFAASTTTDLPFVLLIDTSRGREVHVTRDDGPVLSDIAEAAKARGMIVGLALDDDIAGADGMNSSIASSYTIDFLDQEHLFKILNAFVFAKREQMRPVLHDIYESYRGAFPGFKWSENRFISLYPLHPAILEIAPFVRLYLHEFALLGFASDAGVKILARPANSLIGIDEVFDNVERELRTVSELDEAFAAYDELDRSLIAQMPVMKRHEAKLILKGLFLLSLNDESIDAQELSSAMLIKDQATAGYSDIEEVLRRFAETLPESIMASDAIGRPTRFGFRLGRKDDLNTALAAVDSDVSDEVIRTTLRKQTAEKFADFAMPSEESCFECELIWRGGKRRGEIVWPGSEDKSIDPRKTSLDWTLYITASSEAVPETTGAMSFQWQLATLTEDERETIRRFHLLQTDADIRDKFRDLIPTAMHVHSIAIDKIWQRTFMVDGRFLIDNEELVLSEEARSCHSILQLLTLVTDDVFEARFPEHPEFKRILGKTEVSQLTGHLFGGSRSVTPAINDLTGSFAVPLGLVRDVNGTYLPLGEGELEEIPVMRDAILDPAFESRELIPIGEIFERMRRPPYGFPLEAQHLILASLVAQRRFEFITSAGNRIHHRSLDLQIVWEDIVAVARPVENNYSHERLVTWAAMLTGDKSLTTLSASDVDVKVPEALERWLKAWNEKGILSQFDQLADERLNARIWRVYASVNKTFGAVADAIRDLLNVDQTLDQCLQNIADAFCDSEAEFDYKQKGLAILRDTVESAPNRDHAYRYLVACDVVGDLESAHLRLSLMESLSLGQLEQPADFQAQWLTFRAKYIEAYAARHDEVMQGSDRTKLDEFLGHDLWSKFAELSTIRLFGKQYMEKATNIMRDLRRLQCQADVRAILEDQPTCVCGFDMAKADEGNTLIGRLGGVIQEGLGEFSKRLSESSDQLAQLFDGATHARIMEAVRDPLSLSTADIQILKIATRGFAMPPSSPGGNDYASFESLSDILFENELGRVKEITKVPA